MGTLNSQTPGPAARVVVMVVMVVETGAAHYKEVTVEIRMDNQVFAEADEVRAEDQGDRGRDLADIWGTGGGGVHSADDAVDDNGLARSSPNHVHTPKALPVVPGGRLLEEYVDAVVGLVVPLVSLVVPQGRKNQQNMSDCWP